MAPEHGANKPRTTRSTHGTRRCLIRQGESEVIVGKALAGGKREHVVLATKIHFPMGEEPNARGNSRRWIIREVENSLQRLATDWIDLYHIHRPDPSTDIDETLGALSDLVRQGKIRSVGHSTFPASEIVEAQWTAERRDRERFRCEQPPYSILTRAIEHNVLPTCERYGMCVIPYSPLAGGWLSHLESQLTAAHVNALRRRARPHRRDQPTRSHDQPRRQRLDPVRSATRPATPVDVKLTCQPVDAAGRPGAGEARFAPGRSSDRTVRPWPARRRRESTVPLYPRSHSCRSGGQVSLGSRPPW